MAMDAIRPTVWNISEIPYWYRQNTLVFVHESQYPEDVAALQSLTVRPCILDVVHPDLLTEVLERPDVKTAMRTGLKLPGAIIRVARRRIGS